IVISASAPACCNLIPILTSGEVFGTHTEISITLFDNKQAEEYLKILATETRDLVSPFLRSVSVCTRVEEAFRQAHVIIVLDDPTDKEVYTKQNPPRKLSHLPKFLFQSRIKNFLSESKKIKSYFKEWLTDLCEKNKWSHKNSPIIWRELLDRGGKGLLLGGYNEFLEHAQLYYGVTSSMTTELMKVIAQENLATHIEKELEKEALKSLIDPLQVWITSEWVNKDFVATLEQLTSTGKQFGSILAAHSIATTLKYWYHGSPPGEIVSVGVLSEGT
ncbi:PREDICTED: putative malate dehydrogenase 1B, partial [Hipposideros armiger]|uniref:Malate dehydrogenase 1B n=1 Tax=Hipposideros armiger TaxID=186990 RepID=A0A8B7S9M3_HIPAR